MRLQFDNATFLMQNLLVKYSKIFKYIAQKYDYNFKQTNFFSSVLVKLKGCISASVNNQISPGCLCNIENAFQTRFKICGIIILFSYLKFCFFFVITNFDLSHFLCNKTILTSMGIESLKIIQTYVIAFEKNGIEDILFYPYHFKNCFRL